MLGASTFEKTAVPFDQVLVASQIRPNRGALHDATKPWFDRLGQVVVVCPATSMHMRMPVVHVLLHRHEELLLLLY